MATIGDPRKRCVKIAPSITTPSPTAPIGATRGNKQHDRAGNLGERDEHAEHVRIAPGVEAL